MHTGELRLSPEHAPDLPTDDAGLVSLHRFAYIVPLTDLFVYFTGHRALLLEEGHLERV